MPDEIIGFDRQSITRIIREVLHGEKSPRVAQATHAPGQYADAVQWFPFKNSYAGSIPARSVVRVTGSTKFSTVMTGCKDDWPIYTVTRPDTTFTRRYAVTWGETAAQGGYGLLCFGPTVVVAYDTGTPAFEEGWGPKPGQFTLSLNYPSCATVDAIYDTSRKWLAADWSLINALHGKADGDITARSGTTCGTGTMDIWYLSGSTLTDTTMSVTCKNNSSTKVTSGRYMQAKFAGGQWWADVESCA